LIQPAAIAKKEIPALCGGVGRGARSWQRHVPGCGRCSTVVFLILGLAALSSAESIDAIDRHARRQIQALLREKELRTAAQQKIDSKLIFTLRMSRGQPIADGVESLDSGVEVDVEPMVIVDIVPEIWDSLLERLRSVGAQILDCP
jgi:hypothetical protein